MNIKPRTLGFCAAAALLAAGGLFLVLSVEPDAPDSASTAAIKNVERKTSRPLGNPARWNSLWDHNLDVHYRLELARTIGSHLPESEVAALLDSLSLTPPSGSEEDWWVVMNEIMEQMRRNGTSPELYAACLTGLISDPSNQAVTRDYAVQHLTQWIAPVVPDSSPGEQDPQKIAAALSAISTAIQQGTEDSSTVPGTALLAMTDIGPRLPAAIEQKFWDDLAETMTQFIEGQSNQIPDTTRMAAIQAVASRARTEHRPAILRIAESRDSFPSLRLSSIAALGSFGDPADLELLHQIEIEGGPFQYAARTATERIEAR